VPIVPIVPVAAVTEPARSDTDLERGVREIRRTDHGFDPERFAGYAGMTLRDVLSARMARTADPLRERLTPAMHAELQARGDRLRAGGRSAHFTEVDVAPVVTEAWQDGERDYVTACVSGSMLSHTIDDATGRIVEGSPTMATPIRAFLTFTRQAGLNFWMLSVIQEDCGWGRAGA
jgi:predicted lipid-binding transport protein (Tim44 family)